MFSIRSTTNSTPPLFISGNAIGRHMYKDVTSAYCAFSSEPNLKTIEENLGQQNIFIVLHYDDIKSFQNVNYTRKHFSIQKGGSIDHLHRSQSPSTSASLLTNQFVVVSPTPAYYLKLGRGRGIGAQVIGVLRCLS